MKIDLFIIALAISIGCLNVCMAEEVVATKNTEVVDIDMGLDNIPDIQSEQNQQSVDKVGNDSDKVVENPLNSPSTNIDNNENRFKNIEDEMSYYIENLNLTTQQMAEAKKISNDGILKQKQLLMNLYFIRKQAREIEIENLNKFKAILDEEQKNQLDKLMKLQDKKRYENEKICITTKEYKKK